MSHRRNELMEYANQELMDELNVFMITMKAWLIIPGEQGKRLCDRYPMPNPAYFDSLMFRIMSELKKDAKPMVKY